MKTDPEKQFYKFFQPELKLAACSIYDNKSRFFIGVNGSGKTNLVRQIRSESFKKQFLAKETVRFILLDFKDKITPEASQVYDYWIDATAKAIGQKVKRGEQYNDFSFYSKITNLIARTSPDEKIVYLILDFHELLDQNEAFFNNLYYFYHYSQPKVTYLFFSEPHLLATQNPAAHKFLQWFTGYKYHFMRPLNVPTSLADVDYFSSKQKFDFSKYKKLIVENAHGLHSAISSFCGLIKKDPTLTNLRKLKKAIFTNEMMAYWINDLLESIPTPCVRILKEVTKNSSFFSKYRKTIHGQWLVDLNFLTETGKLRYPLILPFLAKYQGNSKRKEIVLTLIKGSFFVNDDRLKMSKKESAVLELLFKKKDRLCTWDDLAETLWDSNPDKFSLWAIRQIVCRLRRKFNSYMLNPKQIMLIRGEGYKLI